MCKRLILIFSLFFFGCASTPEVEVDCELLEVTLIAPPALEYDQELLRMIIIAKGHDGLIVAVAANDEKEEILHWIHFNLTAGFKNNPNQTMPICGEWITEEWKFFLEGIDFYAYVIGIWIPAAERYLLVDTSYGSKFSDKIKKYVAPKAGDIGKKAIKGLIP